MITSLLILALFVACSGYARWIDRHIDPVPKPSLPAFMAAANGKVHTSGVALFLLYPFWTFMNDHAKNNPPPPPPPEPLLKKLEIDSTLARFGLEIDRLSSDLADKLREAIMATMSQMLHESYDHPTQEIPTEAAVSEQAAKAFADFLKTIPLLATRERATFSAYLGDVVTRQSVDQLFHDLSRNGLFQSTYSIYATASDLGRTITGRVPQKLQAFGFEAIPEKDDSARIEFNLKSYKDLVGAFVFLALPQTERFSGTWIIAPPNAGKTTLLSVLLQRDFDEVREGKAAVIILDSKGELTNEVREYKEFAPGGTLAGKLTLIEPLERPALNPLDLGVSGAHTIQLIEEVFRALDTDTSKYQGTVLRKVILAALTIPGATLRTVKDILFTGQLPPEADISQLHEDDRVFFQRGLMTKHPYSDRRSEVSARFEALTDHAPLLRDMFNAPETRVRMAELMDTPGVVIIDNSVKTLTEAGSAFCGRFMVALILAAAQQREGRTDKLPVYVYLDEADVVISNDESVAKIVEKCRSQKIAMIFAHQKLAQIASDRVKDTLADCAIRIAKPDKDAKALADDFRTDAETLQLNTDPGWFFLYVRGKTTRPLIVNVPDKPAKGWDKMSKAELADIRQKMRDKYSYTPPAPPALPENPPEDTAPQKWE